MDYREVLFLVKKFLFNITSNDQYSIYRLLVDSGTDYGFFCLVHCPGCEVAVSEPGRIDAFFASNGGNKSYWVDHGIVSH